MYSGAGYTTCISSTRIHLICAEPTITGFPSESRANEGEEVVIKPKVGGHPPPSLTWYHDGRKVTADYATELNQDGGLSFPCVETKHAGESSTGYIHQDLVVYDKFIPAGNV